MKTLFKVISLILLLSCVSFATTVSLQVTDADGQVWANGAYKIQFVFSLSTVGPPAVDGLLNSSGAASITLNDNAQVIGSTTKFTVCPKANSDCFVQNVRVTGSSQSVTLTPPVIRIDGKFLIPNTLAYADIEIANPSLGGMYFNTIDLVSHQWNGTTWSTLGSGAGGPPTGSAGGDFTGSTFPNPILGVGVVTDAKSSLSVKPAVTVVAASNIALSGLLIVDDVQMADGSIVLAVAQTAGAENGPWVVHSGSWTRPVWWPTAGITQAVQFATTFVRLGTFNQGTTWRMTTAAPVTIDTTATTWIQALLPAVQNGVAYSVRYPGATLDVRVNACIVDAAAGNHGITSRKCSSVGEAVPLTQSAQINVGNVAQDKVTWELPSSCLWDSIMTGGTSYAIKQFSRSAIVSVAPLLSCEFRNMSTSNGIAGMYTNAGGGYYRAKGFVLESKNVPVTSNAVMLIPGAFDATVYEDIEVLSYISGTAGILLGNLGGPCCSVTFNRVTINNNYTGGIPLDVEANASGITNGIWIDNSSIDHPAAGLPNIKINDTSTAHLLILGLSHNYEETSNADTTTIPNQISGVGAVFVNGLEVKTETASQTAAMISLAGTSSPAISIRDVSYISGAGSMTTPVPIISNAMINCPGNPCVIMSDTNHNNLGTLTQYTSNNSYADSFQVLLDNAVGNASTTRHGWLTKLVGDSTQFLNGSGSFATPPGGGGMVQFSASSVVTTTTLFTALGGSASSTTEAAVQSAAVAAMPLLNLRVNLSVAPGSSASLTITLRDAAANQSLTCTITDPAVSCSDLTHSFTPAAGDLIDWQITHTGTPANANIMITAQFGPQAMTINSGFELLPEATGGLPSSSTTAVFVGSANQVRCVKFYQPNQLTLTQVSVEVTTLFAASHVGAGIYNALGTAKLVDSGALDSSATGVKTGTISATTIVPGNYLYCWTSDSTVTAGRVASTANLIFSATGVTGTVANASVAGVLPATTGSFTGASVNPIYTILQP